MFAKNFPIILCISFVKEEILSKEMKILTKNKKVEKNY